MSGPFQVMPPLTADEYDALLLDISQNGITVPVVYDQHGRLIDGHHRVEIAQRLRIDVPQVVREVANAQEARSLAYSLNLHRRHLSREQKRDLLAASIKADPHLSDRQHAERVGSSDKTAGSVRAELERRAEIPHVETRTDTAGRSQPAKKAEHVCDMCAESFTRPVWHCETCGEHYDLGVACPACVVAVDTATGEVIDIATATSAKQDKPAKPRAPKRKPLPDAMREATYDLVKAVERVERLTGDDRWSRNAEQAAAMCRGDLLRAADALARVLGAIDAATAAAS